MFIETDVEYAALLARCGSPDKNIALASQIEFAQNVANVLRGGVLVGDIVRKLYTQYRLGAGEHYLEFPLDILAPGEEDEYIAYTQPGTGRIADRHIEGDYVRVPTYKLANAIDWDLKFAENANYMVMNRLMEIFQGGFVKKINDDGFMTIISAAADRNILVYDADANPGQFTKRVVSLSQVAMRRNGGGNSASLKRSKLTDIMGSPEMLEDVRNWGIDQLDDVSRHNVYIARDGDTVLTQVFGVNLHDLDEFGEGQVYQSFFTDQLSASLQASDLELAIGLDLSNNQDFVMPIKKDVQVYNDELQHRAQRQGIYGFAELGFAVLDSRRVIAISF